MKTALFLVLLLFTLSYSQDSTYTKYYPECRKIVEAMTLEQKVGQTIQADIESITNKEKQNTDPNQAITWNLGGLMIVGDSAPTTDGNLATLPNAIEVDKLRDAFLKKTRENWQKLTSRLKDLTINVTTKDKVTYKIKLFLGEDAVHG